MNRSAEDVINDHIQRAIEVIETKKIGLGLLGGVAGFGWTLAHLSREYFELDVGVLDQIDGVILQALARKSESAVHEVTIGTAGFGIYGLERVESARGVNIVECAVDKLARDAIRLGSGGLVWATPAFLMGSEPVPPGAIGYNLGLAHGMAGIIAFLAQVRLSGIRRSKVDELLRGSVEFVLSTRLSGALSLFPSVAYVNAKSDASRLSWCYGDLGISCALFQAGEALQDGAWIREAIAIAEFASARDARSSGVRDAGLCHGAVGVAHLFNRMAQATDNALLADASVRWFERTLAFRRKTSPIGGFTSVYNLPPDGQIEYCDPSFISGAAGIGLALLAAAADVLPTWDRVLGTSLSVL